MRYRFAFAVVVCLLAALSPRRAPAAASVVINEFMAQNVSGLRDEDNAYSDWIELQNVAATNVNLLGWYLTDDPLQLTRWAFPARTLAPGAYLVVFASDKNRRPLTGNLHTNFKLSNDGEFLALVRPDGTSIEYAYSPVFPPQAGNISYGISADTTDEVLLPSGAACRVCIPTDASAGTNWLSRGYNDSGWVSGGTGVGYETSTGYETLIGTDVEGLMYNHNETAYIRIPFEVAAPAEVNSLTLRMKYDDGFVAYINGREVARANAPATPAWNSAATASHADAEAVVFKDYLLSAPGAYLAAGTNVLAIQGLNAGVTGADFLILPEVVGAMLSSSQMVQHVYFSTPTPGARNVNSFVGYVSNVTFTPGRRFCSQPVQVALTTATGGATIRYTLDGSWPTAVLGSSYSGPITISRSTVVRAAAFKAGYHASETVTHTYVFDASTLTQPAAPAGYPATWGPVAADYEVDPEIVLGAAYSGRVTNSLRSLPALCLSTHVPDLFDPSQGIYSNPGQSGPAWERATALEWVDRDGESGFGVNCGLRIYGGYFRDLGVTRKKSLRPLFKSAYGASKLEYELFDDPTAVDSFDTFVLRAGANDGYNNWGNVYVQYLIDEFSRRSHLAMGRPSPHGRFVHLYLNGFYWGLYNLAERVDAAFGSSYFGGDKDNWDALAIGEVINGTGDAWNQMINLCRAGLSSNDAYERLQGNNPDRTRNPAYPWLLDVPNYADYMLMNIWLGNVDWPHNNWRAARDRSAASTGFKFMLWDTELSMLSPWSSLNTDQTGVNGSVAEAYGHLRQNAEFRLFFADRLHRHLFNDGVLTPAAVVARYTELAAGIEEAIISETARWGDQHGEPPRTLEMWRAARDNMLMNYLPQRTAVVLQQFRNAGLYPAVDAPVFSRHGGVVAPGFRLSMSSTSGEIFYTVDGTDPRAYGTGDAVGLLYTNAFPLQRSMVVKARARSAGTWSALNEAAFYLDAPSPLRVTELMYHPRSPQGTETNGGYTTADYEFVELQNTGTQTVGLAGVRFTDGIAFDFTQGSVPSLGPGEHVVVVKSLAAFQRRYPNWSAMRIAGEFQVGENYTVPNFSDSGERVRLQDALGRDLADFEYGDGREWPLVADGAGHSLVPLVLGEQAGGALSYGGNWRASAYLDGSPGAADPAPVRDVLLNEILAHTDVEAPPYDSNDAIELFNTRASNVVLSAWYLSDSADNLRKWRIPPTNVIAAGGLLWLDEMTDFHSPITNGFGLNKSGEQVFLSYLPGTAEDRVADWVKFKAQDNSVSLGRYPDGDSEWYAMAPTTNAPNASPNAHVIINEIMYHPRPTAANPENNTNDEYIELYNPTAQPASLWNATGRFRIDGIDYTFPAGITIPAGGYLVLVPFSPGDPVCLNAFLAAYGLQAGQVPILGPYSGRLSNSGERLALERPQPSDDPADPTDINWVIVDEVIYSDQAPWPTQADATGRPLQRRPAPGAGADPARWTAGLAATPGRPAAPVGITSPADGTIFVLPFTTEVEASVDLEYVQGSVHEVRFFEGSSNLSADVTAPYLHTLSHLTETGTYSVTAVLLDDAGAYTSRPIAVVVQRLTVVNGGASNITSTTADLNGALTGGGPAEVLVYWGGSDGHTQPEAWEHCTSGGSLTQGTVSVSLVGLSANQTYYYRCRALSPHGQSWAAATATFTTLESRFAGWDYLVPITFRGYGRAQALTNFPALVTLSEAIPGFGYRQFADPASARDLRFSDAMDAELPYEIEAWATNGSSHVWVRVPLLSGTNTTIWAHWSNPAAAGAAPAYTTNGSVWADCRAVWHMKETNARDATGRGHHGTAQGALANVVGRVGRANNFAGNSFITVPTSADWSFAGDWTWSGWIYTSSPGTDRGILGTWGSGFIFATRYHNNRLGTALQNLTWRWDNSLGTAVAPNGWHHAVCTRSGRTGRFYLDGSQVDTWDAAGTALNSGSSTLEIGTGGPGWRGYWNGQLDEVRLAGLARSADWIWAEWMNAASNSQFGAFGAVESGVAVQNLSPLNVTASSATLQGRITSLGSGGSAATAYLCWGTSDRGTAGTGVWEHVEAPGGTWAKGQTFSKPITGLASNTWYYYRCVASNSTGVAWAGSVVAFMSLGAPAVTNLAASAITTNSATLNAALLLGGRAEAALFWGEAPGGTTPGSWAHRAAAGAVTPGPFAAPVPVLAGGRYYYRACASNALGTAWAADAASFLSTRARASLVLAPAALAERGGTGTVSVVLDAPPASNVTVRLHFGGDAVRGVDYAASATGLVVAAGATRASLTLTALDDAEPEPRESIAVSIRSIDNALPGAVTNVAAAIVNDDLLVSNAGGASGIGQTAARLNGTLVNGDSAAIRVYWGPADGGTNRWAWAYTNSLGTRGEGAFYADLGGLLASRTCFYRCYATNAAGQAWAAASSAFSTLPAQLAVADVTVAEGDLGVTGAVFAVTLSATSAVSASVTFATAPGTALAGSDYQATNGVLQIPAGATAGRVTVRVNNDSVDEWPSERFFLNLSAPSGAGLADSQALCTIEDDDLNLRPWTHRMKITLRGYDPLGTRQTLTNFPVLVVFPAGATNFYTSFAGRSWYELRFANANSSALLSYEVERWNPATNSYVWVRVPRLSGTNTAIWAYWRNPAATNAPDFRATDGSTWSEGYLGVWHLSETSGQHLDSSPYRLNSELVSAAAQGTAAGLAGGCDRFNGIDQRVKTPPFTLNRDTFTVTAFVNGHQNTDWAGIVFDQDGRVGLRSTGYNGPARGLAYTWNADTQHSQTGLQIPYDAWAFVAGVTMPTGWRAYVNGAQASYAGAEPVQTFAHGITMGVDASWDPNNRRWLGLIDEVRIAQVARSRDWLWAEWMSTISNRAFSACSGIEDTRDPNLPYIMNLPPADVLPDAARLAAELTSTGTSATAVWVFWGDADGGVNEAAPRWAHTNFVAAHTGGVPQQVSLRVAGLAPDATNYYRFCAVNASGAAWAPSSYSFKTPGPPRVDNGAGPAVGTGTAELRARLLEDTARLYVCLGTRDAGTSSTGDWEHVVGLGLHDEGAEVSITMSNLLYGLRYTCRAYATNAAGEDWAAPAEFMTVSPTVPRLGPPGLIADSHDDIHGPTWIDPISNLLARTPTGMRAQTNDINYTTFPPYFPGIADDEALALAWHGVFHADESETYSFGTSSDDGSTLFLDLNRDGDFTDAGERIVNNNNYQGETPATGSVFLDGGYYPIALGYYEGGGGNVMRAKWQKGTQTSFGSLQYFINAASGAFFQGMVQVPLGVENGTATGVGASSATLNGTLCATGSVFDVWVHWGRWDGQHDPSEWTHSAYVGSYTNVERPVSFSVSGLDGEAPCYYTFRASNLATNVWAGPSSRFVTQPDFRLWPYKTRLSFPRYSGAALTNFPVLVRLGPEGGFYDGFASAQGFDLRFTAADGTRLLNHEIERWDARGESLVWVQVPALEPGGAVWAYWGNGAATNRPAFTTNGATWEASCRGVWHMGETAARDATARAHHGAPQGAVLGMAGVIGGANEVDPGEYIAVPRSTDFVLPDDYTVSAWIYAHDGNDRGFVGSWANGFIFAVRGNSLRFHASQNGGGWDTAGGAITLNRWHYATTVRQGATARLYLDGVERLAFTGYAITGCDDDLEFGSGGWDWRGWWDGAFDEVRIEGAQRSADWIRACYSNQVAGSGFVSRGEILPAQGIVNRPASGITAASAVLHALLYAQGTGYHATVYWGPADGATNAAAWAYSREVGYYENTGLTNLSCLVTQGVSETAGTYFAWRVTNATHRYWAQPSAGWSSGRAWQGDVDDQWGLGGNWEGDNVPDSAAETAIFAGAGAGPVDLAAGSYSLQGLRFTAGDYTLGGAPGSVAAGTLVNAGGANTIGVGLALTGTAEVAAGTLTLARTGAFSASRLVLSGGALAVKGDASWVPGLTWGRYNGSGAADLNFDDGLANGLNGGLFLKAPTSSGLWTGPIEQGSIGDNFAFLWQGTFYALESGTYEFGTDNVDDDFRFWLDRNRNGEFEGAAGELIVQRSCCGSVYGTVALTGGQSYAVAAGYAEGGGGDCCYVSIKLPSWGARARASTTDAAQSGFWVTGGVGPVGMSGTPIQVRASSAISAQCGTNVAALGAVTLQNGATLTTASGSPLGFQGATLAPAATAVGISAAADTWLTQAGGLDGAGAAATLAKAGSGKLILNRAGTGLDAAVLEVQSGALVGVHAGAFGGAALRLGGGELLLSSPGGNITYGGAIVVATNSTLTAGRGGNGVAGPLTNTVSGALSFIGASTLAVRATDSYTLRLAGPIGGSGMLNLTAGSVIIDDPSFNGVTLNGGSLTVYDALSVNSLVQSSGAFTMAGANKSLSVGATLQLAGSLNLSGGPTLALGTAAVTLNSGANLTYDKPLSAASLTLNSGGALNLGTNGLSVGTLALRNGGTLNTGGPIAASGSMSFWPQRTIANRLTGSGDLWVGDPEDTWGYVALTATNSYAGKTQIRRAVLRADPGVGLPAASRLVFRAAGYDQPCVLETRGSFTRSIGQGAGEVYWDAGGVGGGWAALGGDLVVTLEGGAPLSWGDANAGFNDRQTLIFGSEAADSLVELTNPINLNSAGDRRIHVQNNPNLATDRVRLSGAISGSGSWNGSQLRFGESAGNNFNNALLELTGTNTYSQRTVIRGGALAARSGVGLPAASVLLFQSADANNQEAVLLTSGSFLRNIGSDSEAAGTVTWWWGSGGFAARGGPLTVGFPNAARPLDWGSNNRGFNGQALQLNSRYADSPVTITNHLSLGGGGRTVVVFDNPGTDQDLGRLAGVISGTNPADWLYKNGRGTLWLSATNTMQQGLYISGGVVRANPGTGLPPASRLWFRPDTGPAYPQGVLEGRGVLERTLGDGVGQMRWEPWDKDGGFAAYGGTFTVDIGEGAEVTLGSVNYAWRPRLVLGSWSADAEVRFITRLNYNNEWNYVKVYDNTNSLADRTTMAGNLRNGYLRVYGNGALRLTGTNDLKQLAVQDTATVLIDGVHSGSEWIFTEAGHAGGLGGSGRLTVPNLEIRNLGRLAPGDGAVGTLRTTVTSANGLCLQSGASYEWALGSGGGDRVEQTGNLRLDAGWKVRLLGAGGTPRPGLQYVLFAYSGTCTFAAPALDTSAMPADWVASGASVVHDPAGKRVYLTGLYSRLSVANDAPTDLTSTSATLQGFVSAQADPLFASVYWSTNDGGTSAAAWLAGGFKAELGSFAGVTGQSVSRAVAGLATNQLWYYTFRATNAGGTLDLWAAPSVSFRALGPPVVTNTGARDVDVGVATLGGAFLGHNRGSVTLCWGTADGGTNSPSNWQFSASLGAQTAAEFSRRVTGLLYPQTYVYRVYAQNPYGRGWSAPFTSFTISRRPGPHLPLVSAAPEGHYDAGVGIATSGVTVTSWADQSGWGRHAAAGSGSPVLALNQVNGRPAVKFYNSCLNINSAMVTREEYIVFKSGRYSYDAANPNLFGPDWGGPFGQQNDSHWMFQAGTRQMWDGNKPNAVKQNNTPATLSGNNWVLPGNVDRYMVLKVSPLNYGSVSCRLGRPNNSWGNSCFDVAEVVVFSEPLSAEDEARIGGWLSYKYGISGYAPLEMPFQVAPSVCNLQATGVGVAAATMNARLSCSGAVYHAWVHWGAANGGTTLGNWAHHAFAGTVTGTAAQVSKTVTTGAGTWYYTFQASNAVDQFWAAPATNFTTAAGPAVDNGAGALVAVGQATLRGNLTAGNQADVTIFWGRADGGTDPARWEYAAALPDTRQGAFQAVVAAGYGFGYFYTCRASNEAGVAWSAASTSFAMPVPVVTPPSANMACWYDAGHGVTTDGSGVLTWLDKSGLGHDGTRTAGNPALAANQLNGRPVVQFRGNDDRLDAANNLFTKEQYVVVRSPNANWSQYGAFLGRRSGRDSNYLTENGNKGFHSNEYPVEVRRNGVTITPIDGDCLAPITDWMLLKIVVNNDSPTPALYWIGRGDYSGVECDIAEIIGYSATLSASAENDVGSYLSRKYGISSTYPVVSGAASLTNAPVSGLSTNAATLNGAFTANGNSFDVFVCYGRTNGLRVAANWERRAFLGTFHASAPLSCAATGLAATSQYYFAFMGTNSVTNLWAQPSGAFQTVGPARAENGAATGVGQTRATLAARLTGGGHGRLTLGWGLADGGTNLASWQNTNSFGDVLIGTYATTVTVRAGAPYYYRAFARNAAGEDWADATATFSTPRPAVALSCWPAAGGFSPTNLPGCVAWYRADAGVTTDASGVLGWADQSGGGHTATRSAGTLTLATNQVNGLPAVQFRNNPLADVAGSMFVKQQFAVLSLPNSGDWGAVLGSSGNRSGYMLNPSGYFWDQNYPAAVRQNGGAELAPNYQLGNIGSFMVLRITGNSSDPSVRTGWRLARTEGWNGINMNLAELVCFGRALSADEENRVGAYLSGKYAIATAYPFLDERGGQARVTATASAPSVSNVTVNFSFAGDAARNADYASSADALTIPAGGLSSSLTLTGLEDALQEEDETVTVSLLSLVHATNGSPISVNARLSSDDPQVTNGSGASGVTESSATLNGVLTMGDSATLRIGWGDNDGGTSLAAWDVVIPMGSRNEDAAFATNLAGLAANKTYYYRCHATNASSLAQDWADATASFTTPAPSIRIADAAVAEGDSGTAELVFRLTLSTPSAIPVSITCTAAGGTAQAGIDFAATNAVVTLPAGQTAAAFTVKVAGDAEFENPDQAFFVNLTGAAGCAIADAQGIGTILDDDAAGYFASFNNWMPITFSGYAGTTTLTNWPALVRLSAAIPGFSYGSFASPAGGDLRFASADRTRTLPFEIERWRTNGESVVWVQVPALPPGGATIHAYWNNSAATSLPFYATNGSAWADGFLSVWHMNEPSAADATRRSHNGVAQGGVSGTNGVIGLGNEFDSGEYILVQPSADWLLQTGDFTMSAWIHPHATSGSHGIFGTWDQRFIFGIEGNTMRFHANDPVFWGSSITVSPNAWYYATVTRRGSDWYYYLNGAQGDYRSSASSISGYKRLEIGSGGENWHGWWDGVIDEPRIENRRRPADWVKANYDNQRPGSAFASFGAVRGLPLIAAPAGATNVTADSAFVTARLTSTGGAATATWLYWGTSDGGRAPSAWGHTQYLGQVASAPVQYSVQLTGLSDGRQYYYAYRAANAYGANWAAGIFFTPGRPIVSNGGGATARIGAATLSGALVSDGGSPTAVYTYWGDRDGGTAKAAWGHVIAHGVTPAGPVAATVSNLLYGAGYYYRTYGSNANGSAWAASSAAFTSANPLTTGSRLEIAFTNHTGGALLNFPALVRLGTNIAGFSYGSFLSRTGDDLRFWNGSESLKLNYEFDEWATNGTSLVWVQVPVFTNGCRIWATWGNPAATNREPCTADGSTWSNGYLAVHHMAATEGSVSRDALGAYPGAIYGSPGSSACKVGRGYEMPQPSGNGQYLDLAPGFSDLRSVTIQLWANPSEVRNWSRFVDFGNNAGSDNVLLARNAASDTLTFHVQGSELSAASAVQLNAWQHFTAVRDGATGQATLYRNGARVAGPQAISAPNLVSRSHNYVGRSWWGLGDPDFKGRLDELRISRVPRSEAWVRAEYRSMADPAFAVYRLAQGASGETIRNGPAADVAARSATLHGTLNATGAVFAVTVFWGTSDGASNASAWAHSALVGTYTNAPAVALSYGTGNALTPGATYYFRFRASNAATSFWARPSVSFATPGLPVIHNGSGAAPAVGSALLAGFLVSTGGVPTTVFICWGGSDGGTNRAAWSRAIAAGVLGQGAFARTADNLIYGQAYYYRCFASNAAGSAWAPATTPFLAARPGGVSVANTAATFVTNNSATVSGSLRGSNSVFDVYVHYGTSDGRSGPWNATRYIRSYTNAAEATVTANLGGLSPLTRYYWTFEARNAATNLWAQPSLQFQTPASAQPGDISVILFR